MTTRVLRWLARFGSFLGLLAACSIAPAWAQAEPADEVESDASEADQVCRGVGQAKALRGEGRYREAREVLLACVNADCGGDVRRRCAAALQVLAPETPSIVVRATDAAGNDLQDVTLSIGDEVLAESLTGMAITVDPGEHELVLRRPGGGPVTRTIRIRRGEKFRSVVVEMAPQPRDELPAHSGNGLSSERLAIGATLAGVGAAALASFAVAGLSGRAEERELQECEPFCPPHRADEVSARYLVANISAGVGALALGTAAWVLFGDSGSSVEPRDAGEPTVDVQLAPGLARLQWSGSF